MGNEKSSATADRELLVVRELQAPRSLVWEVWTNPEHIKLWWGPNGFTNTIYTMDVRPGGKWDYVMHGPDGTNYKNKCTFTEVVPPEKIVFVHESGPSFTATIRFEAIAPNKTLITWHMLFDTAEEFIRTVKTFKADEGLQQNIIKLDLYLQNLKQ